LELRQPHRSTGNELVRQAGYRGSRADAELNLQWKITAAEMKARDAQFAASSSPEYDKREGYLQSLLEARRAWLGYRDAHCRDGYSARGASMEPMLVSFCMTNLTCERTEELKALIETEQ
jgi:uncharacterized protein YecT (DUF1311 family)